MKRSGFTLIELSIVLVIVALIAGGIVAGKELIHQSQLRGFMKDIERYKTITYSFKEKYEYYPGDLPRATRFWSSALGNGNGNGFIDDAGSYVERAYFWQHLSLASLVSEQYSGLNGGNITGLANLGVDIPSTSIKGVGIQAIWSGNSAAPLYGYNGRRENEFYIGVPASGSMHNAAFTNVDAKNVDTKMDDGIGSSGKIMATTGIGSAAQCINFGWDATYGVTVTGDYYNNAGINCRLDYFW